MPELVSELIVTMDGHARGTHSPGYFGYGGPEFMEWIATNSALPHRTLMGRKTYEALNALADEARDEGWQRMIEQPGWLFSRTLAKSEWPGLKHADGDAMDFVRAEKQRGGSELRILGSLSIVREALSAGLLDRLKLLVCPLVLPQSGVEPLFAGLDDMSFSLVSSRVLDGRVLLLEYAPAGLPPHD